MVERLPVKKKVAGSNPAGGARLTLSEPSIMPNLNSLLRNKLIYVALIVSVILNFVFLINWVGGTDDGRLYANKQSLCMDFAQSYLRTVQKSDNIADFGGEQWNAAIAIESDFYNMCLLDLSKDNLKNYQTANIERFLEQD